MAAVTTGELKVSFDNLAKDVKQVETYISQSRKDVTRVEGLIALLDQRLTTRWQTEDLRIAARQKWQEKLLYAALVGVSGMIGLKIWEWVWRP